MSNEAQLPTGLRNVVVYVSFEGGFPPRRDSLGDAALLRAANLALRRKAHGAHDDFLFLVVGASQSGCEDAIKAYGFPAGDIVHVECQAEQGQHLPDYDALEDEVERILVDWLTKKHPGAIAFVNSDYDTTKFWWTGIEYEDAVFDWPFTASDFASTLPPTHKLKAATWLTILGHAMDVEGIQASTRDFLGQQRAAVFAAALCEWLHGFEAASGNNSNHFEPDAMVTSLGISPFFLGFEASRLSGETLEEFCDEQDADIHELDAAALSSITRDVRGDLRRGLSGFFGGDSSLFWALHSSIWPKLNQRMEAASNDLLNGFSLDEFAELEAPWSFVTEGWSETADQ